MSLIDEWRDFVAQARRECRRDRLPLTHQFILAKCVEVVGKNKSYTHYREKSFMFKWWPWRIDCGLDKPEVTKARKRIWKQLQRLVGDLNKLFAPRVITMMRYDGDFNVPQLVFNVSWEGERPRIPMSHKDCHVLSRCGHCPRCEKEGVPRR